MSVAVCLEENLLLSSIVYNVLYEWDLRPHAERIICELIAFLPLSNIDQNPSL